MATRVQELVRRYESFEISTLSYDAPDDELKNIRKIREQKRLEKEQNAQKDNTKQSSSHSKSLHSKKKISSHSKKKTLPPAEAETRSPPPDMEIATNSSSQHPDFDTWKKEMTRTLMTGSLQELMYGQDSTHAPKPLKIDHDWKSARLNRRKLEQKWIHQQLRSTKSDNEEDQSSVDAFIDVDKIQGGRTNDAPSPLDSPPRGADATMQREAPEGLFLRGSHSMVEAPLSPKAQPLDSTELAEVMVELSNLKTWSESMHSSIHSRKEDSMHSTIFSSIHSRMFDSIHSRKSDSSTHSRKSTLVDKENSEHSNDSLEIPANIAVPDLTSDRIEESDLKPVKEESEHTTESAESIKDKSIPTFLTILRNTATEDTSNHASERSSEEPGNKYRAMIKKSTSKAHGKKKGVRFAKGFVTDTFYRPWTKEEDIDALYFQEEELMIWDKDEKTTVRDRFEVELATGSPVISYHNSFSYDAHDVTEVEQSA